MNGIRMIPNANGEHRVDTWSEHERAMCYDLRYCLGEMEIVRERSDYEIMNASSDFWNDTAQVVTILRSRVRDFMVRAKSMEKEMHGRGNGPRGYFWMNDGTEVADEQR